MGCEIVSGLEHLECFEAGLQVVGSQNKNESFSSGKKLARRLVKSAKLREPSVECVVSGEEDIEQLRLDMRDET